MMTMLLLTMAPAPARTGPRRVDFVIGVQPVGLVEGVAVEPAVVVQAAAAPASAENVPVMAVRAAVAVRNAAADAGVGTVAAAAGFGPAVPVAAAGAAIVAAVAPVLSSGAATD